MSHEAINWALSCRVGDGNRKLVLYGLANHAHKNGRHAYAGKATLAEYAEVDKRTVARILKRLREDGFIRPGDQRTVEHIRADRRPIVYDLAMSEETRIQWAAAHARGDDLSPRDDTDLVDEPDPRGDTLSPRPRSGVSPRPDDHGVTDPTPRGDTAVSPEPVEPTTPQPPTRCARHPDTPGVGCRACGTTPRQLEAQAEREALAAKRAADARAAAESRAARAAAARAAQSPTTQSAIASMRQAVDTARDQTRDTARVDPATAAAGRGR